MQQENISEGVVGNVTATYYTQNDRKLLFKRKHWFVLHPTVCQSNAGFNNARYATLHCKIFVLLLNNNNNNYINNDDDNNNNNNYNNEEFFDVMDTRTEIGIYATEGILFS